eukprot:jgi/Tetstr1/455796/TSEL_042592.t1
MGDHVLRRFVDEQVVRHGRADVLHWMWLELDWQRWAHFAIPAGPSFASRDAVTAAASNVEAARAAVEAMAACASRIPESLRQCGFMSTHGVETFADPSERWLTARVDEEIYPGASSAKPLCYAAKHGLADLARWLLDRLDDGRAALIASFRVAGVAAMNGHFGLAKLLVEAGGARLDAPPAERYRHRHSVELTIGQSILASGGWLESCWPWLVEERGVDIPASAVVDEAARMLLYFSPGKQDVLEGMRQAQRRRFALAAILVKGGFPAGGGALAEEMRSLDPRTLRDRAGRPVLAVAIAEKRLREVLASLAEALKRQGGQRQGVAPAGTGRWQPLLRQRHLLTKALTTVATSQHHSDVPNL